MITIDLTNKVAFVTGGSRGIGKTIVKILTNAGANVINPSRQELDLQNINSIDNYIKNNKNLKIDIFIHCAGINELAGISEVTEDILKRVFNVNLFAPIHLLRFFHCNMRNNKWGRIIFISSLYGIVSRERRIAYSSSKNALNGVCKSLAIELGKDNILVNCIAPGYVMTDMTKKNLSNVEIKQLLNDIPTGKFQSVEDIANITTFLCSDLNQSITGQVIAVDGGFTCK